MFAYCECSIDVLRTSLGRLRQFRLALQTTPRIRHPLVRLTVFNHIIKRESIRIRFFFCDATFSWPLAASERRFDILFTAQCSSCTPLLGIGSFHTSKYIRFVIFN